jgi:hypothetical protein
MTGTHGTSSMIAFSAWRNNFVRPFIRVQAFSGALRSRFTAGLL